MTAFGLKTGYIVIRTTNNCSITDEDGCRVYLEEPPVCEPYADEELFQTVYEWIAESEENSGEIYCCIESPPRFYADGHTKWARGNLNSIFMKTRLNDLNDRRISHCILTAFMV